MFQNYQSHLLPSHDIYRISGDHLPTETITTKEKDMVSSSRKAQMVLLHNKKLLA